MDERTKSKLCFVLIFSHQLTFSLTFEIYLQRETRLPQSANTERRSARTRRSCQRACKVCRRSCPASHPPGPPSAGRWSPVQSSATHCTSLAPPSGPGEGSKRRKRTRATKTRRIRATTSHQKKVTSVGTSRCSKRNFYLYSWWQNHLHKFWFFTFFLISTCILELLKNHISSRNMSSNALTSEALEN